MKVLWSVALVLSAFVACYSEEGYIYVRPLRSGQTVWITLRACCSFEFDQEKAYGGKRNIALAQYVPLYRYSAESADWGKRKIEDLVKETSALQSTARSDPAVLVGYLKKELGIDISPETAAKLLKYPSLKNLLEGVGTVEESIEQRKIVEDAGPLKGKSTVQVMYPDPVGIVAFPASQIMTIEEARGDFQKKVEQLFWEIDRNVLNPVVKISLATLQPNLKYDQKENDRRIDEIIHRYPSRIVPYKAGDVLVRFRKVLDDKDLLLLAYNRKEERREEYGNVPWTLLAIVLLVGMYDLLLSKIFPPWWRRKPPRKLLFTVLIVAVLLLKACLLFTDISIYALPFAVLPLLLVLLNRERILATLTTLLGAILVCFFSGRNLALLLYFTFGGLAAILSSFGIRKRWHIFSPSLMVGITNATVVLFSTLDWSSIPILSGGILELFLSAFKAIFNMPCFGLMGWAFAGGLLAGPMALLLLPLGELCRQDASVFVLNKYGDLQHPLMRELLIKTPGTYQHAMTMAYLAQAVGEAIGANSLLLRVAAYYHDIGKTVHPEFFVENQHGGKNRHEDLSPEESNEIIMDHVRNGLKIAHEAGLPEVVADFIPQHHGTLLVEYFYAKAVKANPEAEVREEDFRYSGPKPQSVEAAILMIVDAVEATSRTIEEPTPEKLKAMIRHIIEKRMADGQFDECDLSTREIARMVEVLGHSLESAMHTRIKYPWQQEEEEGHDSGVSSVSPVDHDDASKGQGRE